MSSMSSISSWSSLGKSENSVALASSSCSLDSSIMDSLSAKRSSIELLIISKLANTVTSIK